MTGSFSTCHSNVSLALFLPSLTCRKLHLCHPLCTYLPTINSSQPYCPCGRSHPNSMMQRHHGESMFRVMCSVYPICNILHVGQNIPKVWSYLTKCITRVSSWKCFAPTWLVENVYSSNLIICCLIICCYTF